ncbi:uncharacterized protein YraI [Rhizomicrobium palustre]|uniref:Uncharacterized protein YraI n=1 Tax=Rhizomicrobium palustre TaxID=189966 RepID=A0A846N112_9PROT|nr:hypothetical protein [Rhizomicrobium palustre]NIK89608.1 uncharacterized protein YraI [Rhizomicrobium palustre]
MRKLLTAALALTVGFGTLAASAAKADPYDYGRRGGWHEYRYVERDYRDYRGYRDDRYRRHHDNTGTAIAVGVGLIALTAILASQNNDRHYDDVRYAPPPPPPPPRDYEWRDQRETYYGPYGR